MAFRQIKNIWANLTQIAKSDIWQIADIGAPTSGTTGTGFDFAGPGSTYVNLSTGLKYINTGTKASPTWSVLASGSFAPSIGVVAAGTATSGATTATSISVPGLLATDIALVNWKNAPQTITPVIASATTDAISVSFATTVGTAGTLAYHVTRAL